MNLPEQLKEKGWYLAPEAIDEFSKSIEAVTVDKIIQKALNSDFHEVGAKFLPEEVIRGKAESLLGPAVLQIQKIRDVGAPKLGDGYSNSPTLLRVQLTDGHVTCNAIQWGSWKCINQDTPPGTKLYLKPGKIKVQNYFLVLSENQFSALGGVVDALVEKWELNRSLACHIRATTESEGGPPPWVPFGQYIDTNSLRPLRGNFRSLEQNQKECKENEAFEQQRNATIAEIARAKEGKRKVFGGGKQIQEVEGNVYSKQVTTNYRNGSLETPSQTSTKYQSSNRWENKNTAPSSKQEQTFKKWEKGGQQSDSIGQSRPSGGSTLFDFLQSQISLPAEASNLNDTAVSPPVPVTPSEPSWTKNGQLPNHNREKDDKYSRNRQGRYQDNRTNHGNINHTSKDTETSYRPREGAANQRYNSNKTDDYQNRNKTKNFRDYDKARYRNSETNVEAKTNSRYNDLKITKQNKVKPVYDNKWNAEERRDKVSSYNEKQFQSSTSGPYKESEKPYTSKEGDKVLAKYWEDSKYYPAIIHAISSSGTTCVVLFTEYGNYEEVLMEDIQQLASKQEFAYSSGDSSNVKFQNDLSRQNFVGTMEFRRGRNKPYINMDANNSAFRGDKKGDGNSRPARQLYQPPAQRRHVGP